MLSPLHTGKATEGPSKKAAVHKPEGLGAEFDSPLISRLLNGRIFFFLKEIGLLSMLQRKQAWQ